MRLLNCCLHEVGIYRVLGFKWIVEQTIGYWNEEIADLSVISSLSNPYFSFLFPSFSIDWPISNCFVPIVIARSHARPSC